ncbi:hypothetical protein TNCV_1849821 [Trichonephila clavipes]|nr:hypothetical protein TNCV_1849821 [Trichonephila clavipes]
MWKRRGSETAEKRTGRQKILCERIRRTLEMVLKQSPRWWKFLKSSTGISVSSRTVLLELKKLGIPLSCSRSQAKHQSTECEATIAMG